MIIPAHYKYSAITSVIIVIAAVLVVSITRYLWMFMSFAHVLLITDPSLLGSDVYVNGKQVMTIRSKSKVLHFRIGKHVVKVNNKRYGYAVLHYNVIDDEQGSRNAIVLKHRKGKLLLDVE